MGAAPRAKMDREELGRRATVAPGAHGREAAVPMARASRTAVFVCQGRAVADGRTTAEGFADPIALRLLNADERRPVEAARAAEPPRSMRERLLVESLRACAEVVVPRTVAIDEAIGQAGHRQVVVVGAGLDTRPWRLAALRDAVVFAVDHPASQADAVQRTVGLDPVAGRLELVAVDLSADDLSSALARAGHETRTPTTWVWEGVVPYLTPDDVRASLTGIADRSAPGSVLVVNYQARSWAASAGRRLARLVTRLSGNDDHLAEEPWRSLWTPESVATLLTGHRFAVRSDEDLLAIAGRLGAPATHRGSLANGRVAVAGRT